MAEWFTELITSSNLNKILEFIVISLSLWLLSWVHLRLFSSLFQIHFSRKQETEFLVIFSLFEMINYTFSPETIRIVISMIGISILIFFLFRTSYSQLLVYDCILGTICVVADRISRTIFYFIKGNVGGVPFLEMVGMFFIIGILEIVVMQCYKPLEKAWIESNYELTNKKMLLCTGIFLYFMLFLSIIKVFFLPQMSYKFFIFNDICAFIGYLLSILLNFENDMKLTMEEEKMQTLEIHNKTLKLCTANIRNFENEFDNIMQDINSYMQQEDFKNLKTYYYGIMEEYQDIKILSTLNPSTINESAIYNIISNKYYLAKYYGIKVEINVQMNFKGLSIKMYELARILGILLDNAIEAAQHCERKLITISFRNGKTEDMIKISNTYDEKEIDLVKIFEKGFSTKKKNRGLGLWEVKQILEKHSNLDLYTHKEEDIFWQELSIYHNVK